MNLERCLPVPCSPLLTSQIGPTGVQSGPTRGNLEQIGQREQIYCFYIKRKKYTQSIMQNVLGWLRGNIIFSFVWYAIYQQATQQADESFGGSSPVSGIWGCRGVWGVSVPKSSILKLSLVSVWRPRWEEVRTQGWGQGWSWALENGEDLDWQRALGEEPVSKHWMG